MEHVERQNTILQNQNRHHFQVGHRTSVFLLTVDLVFTLYNGIAPAGNTPNGKKQKMMLVRAAAFS